MQSGTIMQSGNRPAGQEIAVVVSVPVPGRTAVILPKGHHATPGGHAAPLERINPPTDQQRSPSTGRPGTLITRTGAPAGSRIA